MLARFDTAASAWATLRDFDGAVEAIAFDGDVLYVAAQGLGILQSDDGGRDWDTRYRPPASR
ncbi:MAG: hypothetical protein ACLGI3_12305 [Actinomycetes bacterium]